MNKKRQPYSAQFKFQVVLDVLKEERTINEIAVAYQIHNNLVTRWKSEFLESGAKAIFARDKKLDEVEELKAEFNEKESRTVSRDRAVNHVIDVAQKKSEGLPIKK